MLLLLPAVYVFRLINDDDDENCYCFMSQDTLLHLTDTK